MADLNSKRVGTKMKTFTIYVPSVENGAGKPETNRTGTEPIKVLVSDINYLRLHQTSNQDSLYWEFQRTRRSIGEFDAWLTEKGDGEKWWNEKKKRFDIPLVQ
jgi:hypothetical protein